MDGIEYMRRYAQLFLISLIISLLFVSLPTSAKTLLDEEISVPALSYYYYSFQMNKDQVTIDISIDTILFAITVIIMDETNYILWASGQTANAYFYRAELLEGDYSVELGPQGVYYIVLDNTDALFPSTVKIKVSYTSPAETTGVVVAAVLALAIILIVILNSNRKKKTHEPQIQPLVQHPGGTFQLEQPVQPVIQKPIQPAVKYCKECGSRLEGDACFCPNCGTEQ
ncbi:MAG: zinc ribbon domain-containing protein [Candidatus Heimdallarchaeaceae archaeon]